MPQVLFTTASLKYNSHATQFTQETVQLVLSVQSCQRLPLSSSRTFHHPKEKPRPHQQLPSSPPQPLTTTNLLSVSVDLPVLDVSHQWTHTLCVLLCLASLTEHCVQLPSILYQMSMLHHFAWLSDAPVCGGTIFCLSIIH